MKNNRKGFTLVELLAVIVILAILMVSAGAGVMATMNNSKINTFKNEALQAVNSAENLYSDVSMVSAKSTQFLTTSEEGQYQGMCVTLAGLVANGYLQKDIGTYGGVILLEVPFDGGQTLYSVWMHNNQYGIDGVEKNSINKLKFKKQNNNTEKSDPKYTYADTGSGVGSKLGIVTNLKGIKKLVKDIQGTEVGAATNGNEKLTGDVQTIHSVVETRGGPSKDSADLGDGSTTNYGGQTYKDMRCINKSLDQEAPTATTATTGTTG